MIAASSGDTSPVEPEGRLTNELRLEADAEELPECEFGVASPGVALNDGVLELFLDWAGEGTCD